MAEEVLQEPDIKCFYANGNRLTKDIAFFDKIIFQNPILFILFDMRFYRPADPPHISSR